jgi:hypothetical protein
MMESPRALLVRLALGSLAGACLLGLASVPGSAQAKDGTFSSPVRFMPRVLFLVLFLVSSSGVVVWSLAVLLRAVPCWRSCCRTCSFFA